MALTDVAVRSAKARTKPYRLYDDRGLYLEVSPQGGRWWRLKYRFAGREKRLALGVYPDVTLAAARMRRDEARLLLADGTDPSARKKTQRLAAEHASANTFKAVAEEWLANNQAAWAPSHYTRVKARIERAIYPALRERPVGEIQAPELLAVLRKVEARTPETAHRVLGDCSQIFRYANRTGRATRNPSDDLRGALPRPKKSHFAAQTEPKEVAGILRAIDGYVGSVVVQCALRLAPLVFVRPGELRAARWEDIDFDNCEWRYIVTKTKTPHIVPLSRQAIAILRELHPVTGNGRFVFPGARSPKRPMSDNAILAAMRRSGISAEEMTGHGFRAMARTILDEVLGVRPDFIEHQLAHAVRDPNGRAYNRTAHLAERRRMMQLWSDYLDRLKAGAEVVPIRRGA